MWIKDRIDTEYKKHKSLDWSKLAEAKILSVLNDKIKELKEELSEEIMDTHSLSLITNAVIVGRVKAKIDKTLGFCTTKVSIKDNHSQLSGSQLSKEKRAFKQVGTQLKSPYRNSPADNHISKSSDIQTAKRCLNFKGCYCENKDCLNTACPLNEKYSPQSGLESVKKVEQTSEDNHSPSQQVLVDKREVVHNKKTSDVGYNPILDTDICANCGHSKKWHYPNANCGYPDCSCKKFRPITKTNDIKGCGKEFDCKELKTFLKCGTNYIGKIRLCPKCEEKIENPDYPESQEEWEEAEKLRKEAVG